MSLRNCQKKRHDRKLGRRSAVMILQSEDLPVMSTVWPRGLGQYDRWGRVFFCFFFACIYRKFIHLSKCCAGQITGRIAWRTARRIVRTTKKRRKKMETKKTNKKVIIGAAVLVVLVAALLVIFSLFGAKPKAGSKAVTLEVVNQEQQTSSYEVQTDAEYLIQAMEEAEGFTFDGETGDYGYTLFTINGETHDWNVDGSYWAIYVNGEYGNYGVDSQPVTDGDVYRFEYTPPYTGE